MKRIILLLMVIFGLTFNGLQAQQLLAGAKLGNQWGFIDPQGNWVIKPAYENAGPFFAGLAAVKTSTGWGYISPDGNLVIPAKYKRAEEFREGLARVIIYLSDNNKWIYIDPAETISMVL